MHISTLGWAFGKVAMQERAEIDTEILIFSIQKSILPSWA